MFPEKPHCRAISDIGYLFGISRSEIYRLLRAGEFSAIKSGRRTLILISSVEAYLARMPTAKFRQIGELNPIDLRSSKKFI